MRKFLALVPALALAFSACADQSTNLEGPMEADDVSFGLADGIPEKATGDIYALGGATNMNHWVFNAHMGTTPEDAKGHFTFEAVDVGWSGYGSVTYVESSTENQACFCGAWTEESSANVYDYDSDGVTEFCVVVVDNGEPSTTGTPDAIEGAFEGTGGGRGNVAPFAYADRCNWMGEPANDASAGNIQVHDNK